MPDSDGFWVLVQTSDGACADPVKLGPSFETDRIFEPYGHRHKPWAHGRVHEMDYDRDGRSDPVFGNEDHFEVARGLDSRCAECKPSTQTGVVSASISFACSGRY